MTTEVEPRRVNRDGLLTIHLGDFRVEQTGPHSALVMLRRRGEPDLRIADMGQYGLAGFWWVEPVVHARKIGWFRTTTVVQAMQEGAIRVIDEFLRIKRE